MNLKRKISRLVGAAALVGAMIGATANPSEAQFKFTKQDSSKIELITQNSTRNAGFLERLNEIKEGYDGTERFVKNLQQQNKLENRSLENMITFLQHVNGGRQHLYFLWSEFEKFAKDYGLSLKPIFESMCDFDNAYSEMLIAVAEDISKEKDAAVKGIKKGQVARYKVSNVVKDIKSELEKAISLVEKGGRAKASVINKLKNKLDKTIRHIWLIPY